MAWQEAPTVPECTVSSLALDLWWFFGRALMTEHSTPNENGLYRHDDLFHPAIESVEHDETTNNFIRLFGEQVAFPPCDRDMELIEGSAHVLDSKVPAPKACFDSSFCFPFFRLQHCCDLLWKITIFRLRALCGNQNRLPEVWL